MLLKRNSVGCSQFDNERLVKS